MIAKLALPSDRALLGAAKLYSCAISNTN